MEGEIARLTDAVAQLGLSNALRVRLVDAEAEYAHLTARIDSRPPVLPSPEAIGAKIREVAVRLETALSQDVSAARAILSGKLGPVILEKGTAQYGPKWKSAPHCYSQPEPILFVVAGEGFEPSTFGL